nr:hypothetical protein [Candidatus Woesebacteria bacterium]
MTISPDTQQNILYALYFVLLHNFVAFVYMLGLIVTTIIGLIQPSRGRMLLMIGFALLLLSFEYSKHIQTPLLNQTKQSLITERYSSRVEEAITLSIAKGAPFVLEAGGIIA